MYAPTLKTLVWISTCFMARQHMNDQRLLHIIRRFYLLELLSFKRTCPLSHIDVVDTGYSWKGGYSEGLRDLAVEIRTLILKYFWHKMSDKQILEKHDLSSYELFLIITSLNKGGIFKLGSWKKTSLFLSCPLWVYFPHSCFSWACLSFVYIFFFEVDTED